MPDTRPNIAWHSIIERVTTPLGFFTLGILIVEGILCTLSLRVSGSDLTILLVGMLFGFVLLCAMVFRLASHTDHGLEKLHKLHLTANDIRVLYFLSEHSGGRFYDALHGEFGEKAGPPKARIEKFQKLGLLQSSDPHQSSNTLHGNHNPQLTREGREVADLIRRFAEPIIEFRLPAKK